MGREWQPDPGTGKIALSIAVSFIGGGGSSGEIIGLGRLNFTGRKRTILQSPGVLVGITWIYLATFSHPTNGIQGDGSEPGSHHHQGRLR